MMSLSSAFIYERPSASWPIKLESLPVSFPQSTAKKSKKKRKIPNSSPNGTTPSSSEARRGNNHRYTQNYPFIHSSSSIQSQRSYAHLAYPAVRKSAQCENVSTGCQKQRVTPVLRRRRSGVDMVSSSSSLCTRQITSAPSSTHESPTVPVPPAKKRVSLLTAIKPENEKPEKERFMRAINYQYNPGFIYRNPADPEILNKFSMPSREYLKQAILIMEMAIQRYGKYENFEEETGGKILTRPQIVASVNKYIKKEDLEDEIQLNLSEDLLSRGSMTKVKGRPTLNVRIVNLREFWVDGLLRHEVGTHYMRSCNNRKQVWSNWKCRRELGLKHFNPTEEGLASIHSVLLRKDPCMWRSALLYYTTYMAAYLPFKELFKDLGKFVKDPQVRWDYCMRAKRGQIDTSIPGTFCKDQVYLEGALDLLENRKWIDFQLLVRLGKIAYQDIDKVKDLADLSDTKIPCFMQDYAKYEKFLDRVAEVNGLTEELVSVV